MKHIIQLELPEEQSELDRIMNANRYYCQLEDIQSFIRHKIKYGEELSEKTHKLLTEINQMAVTDNE